LAEFPVINDRTRLFSAGHQEEAIVLSQSRIFSLGLICSVLIASSDAAVNVRLGSGGFRTFLGASTADPQAPSVGGMLRQPLPTASGTEVLNGSSKSRVNLTDPGNETYANAASGGTLKGNSRSAPSLAAAQGIVVVNPSAYQTPYSPFPEHFAVNSPSNTGHAISSADAPLDEFTTTTGASCLWFGFPAVSGGKLSVKLKMDYSSSGARQLPSFNSFKLSYSLDGGNSWTDAVSRSAFTGSQSGAFTLDLPISQDLTQVQVRDILTAGATIESFASATATISNIRIEVDTVNCIANVPGDRWKGEYYSNQTLSGSPAMVRDDGTSFLNLDFGGASPSLACGLGVDNFSARWTRTVNFASGTHRFTVTGDDGVRLYVGGQLVINEWSIHPVTTYTANVALNAGTHEVKLEYFENDGGAVASLSWADVTSCFANVHVERWKGEYYNNDSLAGAPWMVRDDGAGFLNFDFGVGSPGASCGVGADNFSARWTRRVNFGSGVYRFSVTGDDGVRLYVDGQLKIDKWFVQGATTYTTDVSLPAGNHEVKLEYFESGGPGVAFLSWTLVSGLSCLPDVMIGNAPRTDGRERIATAPVSDTPKRCGQKSSD
jgi:hypothetical protein